ncbi:hypothetical protein B7486_02730 [cyanobacterium TDX16]|nr:hypothetical protein B7486_02730 [cyanobacterium TDX16]
MKMIPIMPREAAPDVTDTDNYNPQASTPRPVSPIFHLFRASPQPKPATRLGSEKNRVCHYMSPSDSHDLRASNALVFTLDPWAPRSLGPFFRLLSPSDLLAPRALFEISNLKFEIPPLYQVEKEIPAGIHECTAPDRAPNGAPGCSHWWSKAPRSKPSATSGQRQRENPTPAGVEESLKCAPKTT